MATYIVTTSNWNDPAFWNAISETGPGHTIDFSGLPSNFDVDFWPGGDQITIGDGTSSFTIGDSDDTSSTNAQLAGSTQLDFFTVITGSAGDDIMDGAGNDDTVMGGDGSDSLYGNGGNDNLQGDSGNDFLDGGSGNDSLYGGAGSDSLEGGTGTNYLDGGGGADTLDGNGGGYDIATYSSSGSGVNIDLSDGSAESGGDAQGDVLSGIEQIDGSELNDTITADSTGMELQGRGGDDTLTGGSGADSLVGGTGADLLDGGSGDDTIIGGAGADTISGGGSGGNNYTQVTNGNVLTGTSGEDAFSWAGGSGNSATIKFNNSPDAGDGDGVADFVVVTTTDTAGTLTIGDFDIGTDKIYLQEGWSGLSTSSMTGFVSYTVTYANGNHQTFDIYHDGSTTPSTAAIFSTDTPPSGGPDGNDSLSGGDDADTFLISDNFGTDTIVGGEGGVDADTIDLSNLNDAVTVSYSGNGSGTISDGNGNSIEFSEIEAIIYGDGANTIDASNATGGMTIDGAGGEDSIEGSSQNDSLTGGSGADTLDGGLGTDTLSGGDDSDVFVANDNHDTTVIQGGEGGDDSGDVVLFWSEVSTQGVTVVYDGNESGTFTYNGTSAGGSFTEIEELDATEFDDSINAQADNVGINVLAGSGDDTVRGGAGDDYIDGGDGDDFLTTGLGRDTLMGGDGNDTLMNSDGDDSLVGGAGNDSIIATGGNDTLEGGSGNDTLDGGADDDSITGGDGDDLIFTGTGNDFADGGEGSDTFSFADAFGNDTIVGGETGTDNDVIDLSNVTGPVTVTFTDEEDGTITDGTDTIAFTEIEQIILTDSNDSVDGSITHDGIFGDAPGIIVDGRGGNDTIIGGRGGDTIEGGAGDDSIDGDYGDDSLSGGADNDTLTGGSGNDTLEGGAGNDVIDAGIEDDTLDGGTGNDSLTGGDGNDLFVYNVGDGADTITDFNAGNSGALGDGNTSNNDFIDLGNFYDDINELRLDFDDDGILNQSNDGPGEADYSNNDQMADGEGITFEGSNRDSFTTDNTGVVCFTSGTAILTPTGDVLIDDLQVGDLVCTMDNGPQRIRWIGTTHLGPADLAAHPKKRPVLIQRGYLGVERDLLVSPQHGILIGRDHLARATHLAQTQRGIRVANGKTQVTYVHILFDAHQIVFAENVPSESFYPGAMALKMMGNEARAQVFDLLPALSLMPDKAAVTNVYGPTARDFLRKRDLGQKPQASVLRAFRSAVPSPLVA